MCANPSNLKFHEDTLKMITRRRFGLYQFLSKSELMAINGKQNGAQYGLMKAE